MMNRTESSVRRLAVILLLGFPLTAVVAGDSAETLLEQARAHNAVAWDGVQAGTVLPPRGGGGPLFIGVDNASVDAQRVDVDTNAFTTAFTGFLVWGAAYDPVGDQVFFNDGSTLLVWPVGGTVSTLGTVMDATGAPLALTGLAFDDGTLYACRNIANEAVYEVDTTTLIATVFIDYADDDFDCGGLAVDPSDGAFYMTNDDTAPLGAGLYRINPDGTGTQITPYPAGQTDIDGLAIGDGRAYLIIDEPGDIFIWDFALAAYQTPLANPWATSELFSAGAWIGAPAGGVPAITLDKTVGLVSGVCGADEDITVPAGTEVTYCFTVTNTGDVTLGLHDLSDTHLGVILNDFPLDLDPGDSTFITVDDTANATVTNTATWTASVVGGPMAMAEDSATVNVSGVVFDVPALSRSGLVLLVIFVAGLALAYLRRRYVH